MNIQETLLRKRAFSLEVFPPKPTTPAETIYRTLDELRPLAPDFISVTYSAGGNGNNAEAFRMAAHIRSFGTESVAHLPGRGLTRETAAEKLDELKSLGVRNILALRGDRPASDETAPGDFPHASDLISFIKARGDFYVLAACYPETHPESASAVEDILNLKKKVDAGADHLITQLFLDNGYFYAFRERCALAGIRVPTEAGIMPVVNKRQIERMSALCGSAIPPKFAAMMARYEHSPVAMRDAGIAYAVDQIVDLLAQGVDGIHLYTMNNAYIARRIHEAVRSLIDCPPPAE